MIECVSVRDGEGEDKRDVFLNRVPINFYDHDTRDSRDTKNERNQGQRIQVTSPSSDRSSIGLFCWPFY